MPYARKTLLELRADILGTINAARITSTSGTVLAALLQKAILRYVAYAQAGVGYSHYSELDYISKQAVPWTATDEFLEGWASLKGVTRKPATSTVGTATFPANSMAASVPAGTQIVRSSDGFSYATTAGAAPASGVVTVTMQANVTGPDANFDAGTVFQLGSQTTGVQSQSTASTQVTAGADQETDDSLRTRMLQVYAAPPQGGDAQDYVEWALAVPGVTRAWVAPNASGAGTVTVFFMMDAAQAAHGGFPQGSNGVATNETRDTPATGDQLTLANALYTQRPVTARVYSCAPAGGSYAFTIADLGSNNTPTMQAAIIAALTDMFLRLGNVGGTVQPDIGAQWPAIEPDDWYDAVSAIPGLTGFKVTAPNAALIPAFGVLPTLGVVTFIS